MSGSLRTLFIKIIHWGPEIEAKHQINDKNWECDPALFLIISNFLMQNMNEQRDICEQEKISHLFDIKQELN